MQYVHRHILQVLQSAEVEPNHRETAFSVLRMGVSLSLYGNQFHTDTYR